MSTDDAVHEGALILGAGTGIGIGTQTLEVTDPDPAEVARAEEARAAKRARLKPTRPVRIPDPQTPDEFFIAFGDICAAQRAEMDALKKAKKKADSTRDALLSLPYLYVKSDEELAFVREISLSRVRFMGRLYLGPNVSADARLGYTDAFPLADVVVGVAPMTTFE